MECVSDYSAVGNLYCKKSSPVLVGIATSHSGDVAFCVYDTSGSGTGREGGGGGLGGSSPPYCKV